MAKSAFARRKNKVTSAVSAKVKQQTQKEKDELAKKIATSLPVPCGYKILIMLPEIEETTDGGIIKAAQTKDIEEVGSIVGYVLELGPDAYVTTPDRQFSQPYCKKGDFVIMRAYSGTRFTVHGKEFRLINDDTVEAVVDDPRGIMRK